MRNRVIALAVLAVLVFALALPALAQTNALNPTQSGVVSISPEQTFVGRVVAITQSDLPRFELVGTITPPNKPGLYLIPPIGAQRYVLLTSNTVVADTFAKLAKADKAPLVRVTGISAYIPSTRGVAKAIVVVKVEIVK